MIPESDQTVTSLANFVASNGCVPDGDPIVVVRSGELFSLLSGSKRIKASKIQEIRKIDVNVIDEKDSRQFSLRKFFSESRTVDTKIVETMGYVKAVFEHFDLPLIQSSTWKDNDWKHVFGNHIKPESKIGRIFKLCSLEDLADKVEYICGSFNIEFSSRILYEIINKYRENSVDTISLLSEVDNNYNENKFRLKLKSIDANLTTLLSRKVKDPTVVSTLAAAYEGDKSFSNFVKGADMRWKNGKNIARHICSRYEEYKTAKTDVVTEVIHQKFEFSGPDESTDILLTTNSKTATSWLDTTVMSKDRIAFVFSATVPHSSIHSILLPDSQSMKNRYSLLCNRLTVSILIKQDGLLAEDTISAFFESKVGKYRETYKINELEGIIKTKKICVNEFHTYFHPDFVAELVSYADIVQVNSEAEKDQILSFIKRRQ
uniref:DUF262 domain-containing protein n=1 Tax=Caenorhabditis tropicalis TaxID=1561998 RepID=A0A1I7TIP7_9PELO